jgi:hypothetical protein
LFSDLAWGSAGNLARNHFYGSGVDNWDMLLQKTLSLSERFNLQIRGESYNLFNRAQFGQAGNLTFNPSTLGQSTSEVKRPDLTSGARQIQFGMKLSF